MHLPSLSLFPLFCLYHIQLPFSGAYFCFSLFFSNSCSFCRKPRQMLSLQISLRRQAKTQKSSCEEGRRENNRIRYERLLELCVASLLSHRQQSRDHSEKVQACLPMQESRPEHLVRRRDKERQSETARRNSVTVNRLQSSQNQTMFSMCDR